MQVFRCIKARSFRNSFTQLTPNAKRASEDFGFLSTSHLRIEPYLFWFDAHAETAKVMLLSVNTGTEAVMAISKFSHD